MRGKTPRFSLSFFPSTSACLPYLFSINFIFGIPVEASVAYMNPRPLPPKGKNLPDFLREGCHCTQAEASGERRVVGSGQLLV